MDQRLLCLACQDIWHLVRLKPIIYATVPQPKVPHSGQRRFAYPMVIQELDKGFRRSNDARSQSKRISLAGSASMTNLKPNQIQDISNTMRLHSFSKFNTNYRNREWIDHHRDCTLVVETSTFQNILVPYRHKTHYLFQSSHSFDWLFLPDMKW